MAVNKLLEKAKLSKRKRWTQVTLEEIEIAVAVVKDETSIPQIMRAKNGYAGGEAGMAYRLMSALRKGVSEGRVTIELKQG